VANAQKEGRGGGKTQKSSSASFWTVPKGVEGIIQSADKKGVREILESEQKKRAGGR